LVEIEHDAAGLMNCVRTDLYKIWEPRIARWSNFGAPHGALYHDVLGTIQGTGPSSAELRFQFKMPAFARTVAIVQVFQPHAYHEEMRSMSWHLGVQLRIDLDRVTPEPVYANTVTS
jgi:hypothetical protein